MWILIMILLILLILIIVGIVGFFLGKKERENIKKTGKYPEGYFISISMGLGVALGMPLGLAFGGPQFYGLGMAISLPIGLTIGMSIENKYKKEGKIRPLTKQEKKRKQIAMWIGIGLLVIGVITGLVVFLMR